MEPFINHHVFLSALLSIIVATIVGYAAASFINWRHRRHLKKKYGYQLDLFKEGANPHSNDDRKKSWEQRMKEHNERVRREQADD